MTLTLTTHADPSGRFALDLPADWITDVDPAAGVSLVAAEPGPEANLRPNLVVTVDRVDMGFKDWQLGNDQLLASTLTEYQLIDLELGEVDGHPAVRRLAHHTVEGMRAATVEQWCVQAGEVGYTLTFTVPTLRYRELREGIASMAATLDITDGPRGETVS